MAQVVRLPGTHRVRGRGVGRAIVVRMTDSKNDQVVVERQIVIAASQRAVFDFVADYRNDPQWRSEVERMDVPRPYEIGVPFTEYATHSGTKTVTPNVLVEHDDPRRSRIETPESFPHRLEVVRTVESIDANTARFIYRVAFDRELLLTVRPELPPADEFSAWYGAAVDGYLTTLKALLEK